MGARKTNINESATKNCHTSHPHFKYMAANKTIESKTDKP